MSKIIPKGGHYNEKTFCIIMAFVLILALCSCGSSIGGKEIKTSSFSVSTLENEGAYSYTAYGIARMVDVYGNVYTNNFSCDVEKDSDGS